MAEISNEVREIDQKVGLDHGRVNRSVSLLRFLYASREDGKPHGVP